MVSDTDIVKADFIEESGKKIPPLAHQRRISPLTFRILVVNVIALIFLGGGILYVDQFQEAMIQSRIESMIKDGEVMAGALGEAATGGEETTEVNLKPAIQIITRLSGVTRNRSRFFSHTGDLRIDSRELMTNQAVIIDELPPEGGFSDYWRPIEQRFFALLDSLQKREDLEDYHEVKDEMANHYPEVMEALQGDVSYRIRRLTEQAEIITVAVPVQRFRRVLGALMLSMDTHDIKETVQQTRVTILKIFGVALLITLALSIFLARTIVRPIKRLARSADRIRLGTHTSADIPDYSGRYDEIGDLSRALKDMTRTLARQIDAVATFAADVSHELKNPLTSLRSAVETLGFAKTETDQAKLTHIIKHDVDRLDRLISDISNTSRLDAEISRSNMVRVNMKALLETLRDMYHSTRKENSPTLKLRFFDGQKEIKGDDFPDYSVKGLEGQLAQVAQNLIDNAMSFSKAEDCVNISLIRGKAMISLVVEDQGIGIPEDKLEDIFERFYSERPEGEGFGNHSGLGLSICKQIIEAHGGMIRAENRKDERGARFVVRLPLWA